MRRVAITGLGVVSAIGSGTPVFFESLLSSRSGIRSIDIPFPTGTESVLAGAVATFSLPVALFPMVSFPRVRISLDSGDRPAEQMAIEVTTPVEEAVRAIPGVRNVRSATSRGSAEI